MPWNLALFWEINHLAARTGWAHPVMAAFALWGGPVLLVLLLTLAWWTRRGRADAARALAAAVLTGVAALVSLGFNQLFAALHTEVRPFIALRGVTVLLGHSADNSFPSDHAALGAALAAGILVFARGWGAIACAVAVFLAFARVYAGMHYPLDVLAGLAIGAAAALLLVPTLSGPLGRAVQRWTPDAVRPLAGIEGRGPGGSAG
ncbi:phosphatase PAP2 family protein [Amycolatopsis benzoatilytica]|uniref:phosphatase PAP2 family protein n=1 Tax=Amycolatopsis benzoatilytica TaxID=346045 RepID=UPI00146D9728|nr:phosphatase PAP2 family protein [Amycolatopsis benzoatilytica]